MKYAYILWHVSKEGSVGESLKLIGVYTKKALALEARRAIEDKPGFREYPDGFEIARTTLNGTSWRDGFVSIYDIEIEPVVDPNSDVAEKL